LGWGRIFTALSKQLKIPNYSALTCTKSELCYQSRKGRIKLVSPTKTKNSVSTGKNKYNKTFITPLLESTIAHISSETHSFYNL
jgi:hypothetical protein